MTTATESPVTVENRLTLAEAARMVGKSPAAVFRWISDGVRGERLDHIRLGRSIFTSEAAINDFGRRVADARTRARENHTASTGPRRRCQFGD